MNEFITLWVCYIIEYAVLSILSFAFLGKKDTSQISRCFLYIIPFSLAGSFIEYNLAPATNALFINIFILYVFLYLVFRQSALSSIFLTILSFALVMFIQVLIVVAFSITGTPVFISQEIFGNLCTLIISFLLSLTIFPKKLYSFIITRNLPVIIAVVNLSIIALILNIFHKLYPDDYKNLLTGIIIPIILIVYMNIIMIREYTKQKQKEKQLMTYKNYLPVIEEMIDQLRRRQHKFDNEIQTIKGLSKTCNDYFSLKTALDEYSSYIEEDNEDTGLLKLNFKFLAALIYQKARYARSSNKNFKIELSSSVLYTCVPEYELIDIAGILIDNMIEATPEGTCCKLTLKTQDNKVIITTLNPSTSITPQISTLMFTRGYTTKENSDKKHGYGLYELSEIVKKYDGKIFLENVMINNLNHVMISVKI